jgi:hypothetical protein
VNGAAIQATINSAIAIYESTFADPITVSIKFQSSNSGLGSSSTFFANVAYQTYPNALIADGKSADDAVALAGLPGGPNNPVNGASTINVKTANLRAVGINVNPPAGQPDGTITLNTLITTPGSPGTTAQYFLMPVVMHEINEVFGLGSSLPGISIGTIFPEDLDRYNNTCGRSFTTSPTAQACFSIDCTTLLAQFDNQNDGGDFGDWQSNPLPGGVQPRVQDAFASPGANPSLGVELRALDVIGYDLAVPEPVTAALLLAGLGLIAARRRSAPRLG